MRKLSHDEIPRLDPLAAPARPRYPISVVADNLRSVYNVGAIFRTSDAAWIEKLYLTGITGTPDHRGLRKTALGSQDTVPWTHAPDALATAETLRAAGYTIGVLEITDQPTPFDRITLDHFPLCLVVGNEVDGVSDAIVEVADVALEIPQFGAKQSLNVSVAYGVAIFQLVQQYRRLTLAGGSGGRDVGG